MGWGGVGWGGVELYGAGEGMIPMRRGLASWTAACGLAARQEPLDLLLSAQD